MQKKKKNLHLHLNFISYSGPMEKELFQKETSFRYNFYNISFLAFLICALAIVIESNSVIAINIFFIDFIVLNNFEVNKS